MILVFEPSELREVADIFISYSKVDRDVVVILARFLESEGWTVWFDKGLSAGDTFRDEIMKQLALARAVITVWTEHSVKSDWVRAEAGRANPRRAWSEHARQLPSY